MTLDTTIETPTVCLAQREIGLSPNHVFPQGCNALLGSWDGLQPVSESQQSNAALGAQGGGVQRVVRAAVQQEQAAAQGDGQEQAVCGG